MAWFYSKKFVEGSVLSYQIRGGLVNVKEPQDASLIRAIPAFTEITEEEAAKIKAASPYFIRKKAMASGPPAKVAEVKTPPANYKKPTWEEIQETRKKRQAFLEMKLKKEKEEKEKLNKEVKAVEEKKEEVVVIEETKVEEKPIVEEKKKHKKSKKTSL